MVTVAVVAATGDAAVAVAAAMGLRELDLERLPVRVPVYPRRASACAEMKHWVKSWGVS